MQKTFTFGNIRRPAHDAGNPLGQSADAAFSLRDTHGFAACGEGAECAGCADSEVHYRDQTGSNMRALVLGEEGYRFHSDREQAQPVAGEVLVRVLKAGICETDLQLIQGYMGFQGVLGHEFVGIAESGEFAGKRVVGEINCCSGQCCQTNPAGRRHCPNRTVLGILNHDGAFADYVAVPQENLHVLPENVENDRAVFIEPLAAAFEILEQIDVKAGKPAIVLGDGRLGYLCAQVLSDAGADVTVVGKHAAKLERFAAQKLKTCLLNEIPDGWFSERNAELVVDCTGNAGGIELALQLVRPRGVVVMKTTIASKQTLSLAPLVIDEIQLIGSRCGPFDVAIRALEESRIEVESLITARFPLEEIETAMEVAQQRDQHKVLIEFE